MRNAFRRCLLWGVCALLTSANVVMEAPIFMRKIAKFLWAFIVGPLFDVPYRKPLAILLSFLVPILLGIGFAVEEVDVINDSYNAIRWFGASAILAAILVIIWEEIALTGRWSKIVLTLLLEFLVVDLFFQGSRWAVDKSILASNEHIQVEAQQSALQGMYRKWLASQQTPNEVKSVSHPLSERAITRPLPKPELPDIALALIYPTDFSAVILNLSSVVLYKPKWSFAVWDLDQLDASGHVVVLPIRTDQGDWIRGHEILGPEMIISQVETLVKPGDRLFGWAVISCPDCKTTKAYWISATHNQGGWFSEMHGKYPDLSRFTGDVLLKIRGDTEAFFSEVITSDRIPIYRSVGDIPFRGAEGH